MKQIEQADMKEYTSFRAGGKADVLYIADTKEELLELLKKFREKGTEYLILGNGTNTLARDEGIRIPVVKLGEAFEGIEEITEEEADPDGAESPEAKAGNIHYISAGAAALMSACAKKALSLGLSGFEPLSGIPGSIGGALFMNGGAYGTEMKDIAVSAEVLSKEDLSIRRVPLREMDLSYRHSRFQKSGDLILSVQIRLSERNPEEISDAMKSYAARRNEKQPVRYPSAGSFFKRPDGYYAGALIQEAGLKGLSVGGAQVSELHAGFIINRGGATAQDIIDLMHLVQNTVYMKSGVRLEPEVRIIGG